jgi:hypothetical protein
MSSFAETWVIAGIDYQPGTTRVLVSQTFFKFVAAPCGNCLTFNNGPHRETITRLREIGIEETIED